MLKQDDVDAYHLHFDKLHERHDLSAAAMLYVFIDEGLDPIIHFGHECESCYHGKRWSISCLDFTEHKERITFQGEQNECLDDLIRRISKEYYDETRR